MSWYSCAMGFAVIACRTRTHHEAVRVEIRLSLISPSAACAAVSRFSPFCVPFPTPLCHQEQVRFSDAIHSDCVSSAIMVGTLCQPCGLCRGERFSPFCVPFPTPPHHEQVRFEMRFTVIALPPPSCWVPAVSTCGWCRGERFSSSLRLCVPFPTPPHYEQVRFDMRFTVIARPPPSCWTLSVSPAVSAAVNASAVLSVLCSLSNTTLS